MKLFLTVFISVIGLLGCFIGALFAYHQFFYLGEMNEIEDELNQIENVEVLGIWGHEDLTLEEVSARLKIKDKGEIVLYGLSEDSFDYPKSVPIIEIGGYSFTWFSCNGGIGPSFGIGTDDVFGNLTDKEFHSVKSVVDDYDYIIDLIESLKMAPELNHFETTNSERYLLVSSENSEDQDPIYNLIGIESGFEFAKTLKWNREDCYYNK